MSESQSPSDARMTALLHQLAQMPGIAEQLPGQEGMIVRDAMNGHTIYQIAQDQQVSERAVWDVLSNAARMAAGQPVGTVETGGLGSDTDPGVTGGYGETGFGSIGNEPPEPISEEPDEQASA